MVMTANNFAYITLCIFSAARLWIHTGSSVAIACINTLCWTASYCTVVYSKIHFGHFSKREVPSIRTFSDASLTIICWQALRTANLLHKIENVDRLGLFTRKILMFSQQLSHRVPVFSCGLFIFDLSLAFKVTQLSSVETISAKTIFCPQMISAVTIYLIILIQFETSSRFEVLRFNNESDAALNEY